MKLLNILSFLLVGSIIAFESCQKESLPEEPICFQTDILPIMVSNCTFSGCHNAAEKKAGYDMSNYDGILTSVNPGKFASSKLYKSITAIGGAQMPQSPRKRLNDSQIELIARWIKSGAENTMNCVTNCDTTNVSYVNDVLPIINSNCVGCHSGTPPLGDIDYTTYQNIRSGALQGKLLASIQHASSASAMPKSSPKLPDCQINTIERWIKNGAPNN